MRRISFATWAKRQLSQQLDGRFNLRELAAIVQHSDDDRLKSLMLLYAASTSRTERLLEFIWDENLANEYRLAASAISQRSIEKLALRGTPMHALNDTYNAVMAEFVEAYNVSDEKASTKKQLWAETRDIQLRYGISNCTIYNGLKLNPGNVNAYLKYGATEKVSIANARRIKTYAESLANPQ